MMKMIRYYEDWKATTECKKFIVYCDRMINHFKGGRKTEIKYKHNKIYVGSLNKSFKKTNTKLKDYEFIRIISNTNFISIYLLYRISKRSR
jgi:hypothetical protein